MNPIVKPNTFANGIGNYADATEVNENFDVIVSKLNEIVAALNAAQGSAPSLDGRLDISLNEDGTARSGVTAGEEWVNPQIAATYVDASNFEVTGDYSTTLYAVKRAVKVSLSGGAVFARVSVSSYAPGTNKTTVTLDAAVLDATMSDVEHGLISVGTKALPAEVVTDLTGDVTGNVTGNLTGDVTGTLNGDDQTTAATANKLVKRDANGDVYANALYVG